MARSDETVRESAQVVIAQLTAQLDALRKERDLLREMDRTRERYFQDVCEQRTAALKERNALKAEIVRLTQARDEAVKLADVRLESYSQLRAHVEATNARAEAAHRERDEAQQKLNHWHRRAQKAEAELCVTAEERDRQGLSIGRRLAGATWQHYKDRADDAERLIRHLRDALEMIEAIICDKELCGHFTAEEIRSTVRAAPIPSSRPPEETT